MTSKTNTTSSSATVAANPTRDFGVALFKKEAASAQGKNVLISPASVAIALAMTMNGANSSTLTAMKTALGFSDSDTVAAINASMSAMLAALADPQSGVELNVANAIWAEQSMQFKTDFVQRVADCYKAVVNTADFKAESTKGDINKWASDNTRGKIPTIIDNISPDMVMFLLNAIYFKGKWTTEFDKGRTYGQTFTAESGSVSQVPFMSRVDDMTYAMGKNYSAAVLPFGESRRVALYVMLPDANTDVNSFIQSLDKSVLAQVKAGGTTEVMLQMPRFKLDYDVDLKASLSALGMQEAFGSGANLSGMADADLKITAVKHKTYAKFDEEGGEAAAVTSVGVGIESVCMTIPLVLDRPFVMALVDQESDTLLFIGKVAEISS